MNWTKLNVALHCEAKEEEAGRLYPTIFFLFPTCATKPCFMAVTEREAPHC